MGHQVNLDSDDFFRNIPPATEAQKRAVIRVIRSNVDLTDDEKDAFLDALGLRVTTVINLADVIEEVKNDLGLRRGA